MGTWDTDLTPGYLAPLLHANLAPLLHANLNLAPLLHANLALLLHANLAALELAFVFNLRPWTPHFYGFLAHFVLVPPI